MADPMGTAIMTEHHLPAADQLRRLAGWNQTLDDWRRLLSLEPDGCFVAIEDGDVIGTVTTATYGQELAWIGMMLVHPNHRRRGIGTELMRKALDHLHRREIACIKLDATPAGHPVYEKLGFVSEWTLTRYQAAVVSSANSADTRDLTETDWPTVEKIDSASFGLSRSRVLRTFAQAAQSIRVWPVEGTTLGYGMLRPGSQSDYLGPIVCANPDGASCLVAALLQAAGTRPIFWDVPDENARAIALAKQFGFTPLRPLLRMRLGPNTVPSHPSAQLAIVDPSVG